MTKNNNYKNIFNNKSKIRKFNLFKSLSLASVLLFLLLFCNLFLNYKYSTITDEFFSEFNKSEFSNAKSILDNKLLYLKNKSLQEDLESYFTDIVDLVCTSLDKNEITSSRAIEILSQIKDYNVLSTSLDTLIDYINDGYTLSSGENIDIPTDSESLVNSTEIKDEDDNNYFDLGLNSYNSKDYSKSYEYFNLYLSSSNSQSNSSVTKSYLDKIKYEYKDSLLLEADELLANKYYTKSINLLSEYNTDILGDYDVDIYNKISSIEHFKEEYTEDIYTSSAILQSINLDNVNSFAIDSKTDYFVYVNLKEQTTYVYKGFLNNWKLVNTFLCSTGIAGKETPKGIFSVSNRGDWFFAEEFNQGAKYWVQFMGDYLFHSVPFDETQDTIVDNTLGVAASHGCIRLAVEDSKWLYDNITDNTKIIIN